MTGMAIRRAASTPYDSICRNCRAACARQRSEKTTVAIGVLADAPHDATILGEAITRQAHGT